MLALVVAVVVTADIYPRVVRKGELTCVQSLDDKGGVVEQCRKEGSSGYDATFPRTQLKGDQLCTETLDEIGKVQVACKPAPPRPAEAPRRPAGEYPRVVRKDGQICVLSLDEKGAVVESCRTDTTGYQPHATPGGPAPKVGGPRSARLLVENSDPAAGRRMIVSGLAGIVAAPIPLIIVGVACGTTICDATPLVFAIAGSALLMGFAAGIAHGLIDGKAGVGWGLIGSTLGFGAAAVLAYIAATVVTGLYVSVVLYALAGILPIAGTVIALEIRDTQMRYGPPEEEAPEEPAAAWLGRVRSGGLVVRF